MAHRPFIIDCDTGRDDALTLMVAKNLGLPLVGVVASYGNTTLSHACTNTQRVLTFAGLQDIPLLAGAQAPLSAHALYAPVVLARQETTGNGLCNLAPCDATYDGPASLTPQDMAAQLDALVARHGRLDYFVIGPATNLAALAQLWGAEITQRIGQITMMGGKLDPMWSDMPGPDFNIASDPAAVDILMRCGCPMRFLPMNATWPIMLELHDIEKLRPRDAQAAFAKDLMIAHCRHFAPEPVFRFHDPAILLAAQHTDVFVPRNLHMQTNETHGEFGRLIDAPEAPAYGVFAPTESLRSEILRQLLDALGFEPLS